MSSISQVDIQQVHEWVEEEAANILDIRDPMSFSLGHIPKATNVSSENVAEQIETLDKSKTLVICCYHGISSQEAAGYFMQHGFQDVHSMIGGYEAWKSAYPSE